MKGRWLRVLILVIVLTAVLVLPASAAKTKNVNVTSWSTPPKVPGWWTASISGEVTKGSKLYYGLQYRTVAGGTWIVAEGNWVLPDPGQRYPQNLSVTLPRGLYLTGQGSPCEVHEYVQLYDATKWPLKLLAETSRFTSYCVGNPPP